MKITFKQTLIVFCLILVLGTFLRTYKLGNQSFIADEYLGINASYGYFQTGEWKFWDFNMEKITDESYTRGKVYYWQVAQVFKFMNPTEANSRLISVAWGIFGIIATFFITYIFTRSKKLSLLASLLLAVSISALIYDRKLRMYSMFSPVYFLFAISVYQFFESKYQCKIKFIRNISNKTGFNWIFIIPSLLLGFLSLKTHLLTVNIIPVIFCYVLILFFYDFIKNKKFISNKYLWGGLILVGVIFLMFQTQYLKDAVGFFSSVDNWGYLEKITLDYSYIILAITFIVLGSYYLIKRYQKFGIWIVLSFFVPVLLAVFTWNRNAGDQYIYFTQIFKVIIYAAGIYFVAKKIADNNVIGKISKEKAFILVSLFSVILSVNFSYFFSEEGFYSSAKKWDLSNYREVYKYYIDHQRIKDVLITRSFMNYYLKGNYGNIIDYGEKKELSLEIIKKAENDYKRVWVVFSKDIFIDGDAQDYIEENFELIETPYTNNRIEIWRSSEKDDE